MDLINISGIALEIMGFILILKATEHPKRRKGGFDNGLDVDNVMTIAHPSRYNWGIVLVIAGLAIQIIPSAYSLLIS